MEKWKNGKKLRNQRGLRKVDMIIRIVHRLLNQYFDVIR